MLLLAHGFGDASPRTVAIAFVVAALLGWGHLRLALRGLAEGEGLEGRRGAALASGLALLGGLLPFLLLPLQLLEGPSWGDLRTGAFLAAACAALAFLGGYPLAVFGWAAGRLFAPPGSPGRELERVGLAGLLGGLLLGCALELFDLVSLVDDLQGTLLFGPRPAVWASAIGLSTLAAVGIRARVRRDGDPSPSPQLG